MMRALLQTHLAQPPRCFCLRLLTGNVPQQQRHGHILQSRKFRQQVMELPNKAEFAVTKLGSAISDSELNRKWAQYTSPAEALSRAPRMCNRVLFPAPDSPTMASISPSVTWNERFSKSTRSDSPERKTFFRASTRRIGSLSFRCKCLAPRLNSGTAVSFSH